MICFFKLNAKTKQKNSNTLRATRSATFLKIRIYHVALLLADVGRFNLLRYFFPDFLLRFAAYPSAFFGHIRVRDFHF